MVIDASGGESFNRGIFGQNAHAGSYISEGYQAAYEKNLLLLDRTSIRGVVGGVNADTYNWKSLIHAPRLFVRPDGQVAKAESTLELLRQARDTGSELIITVNAREIGVLTGDEMVYQTSDTSADTLGALAKDWVRYTNHILQTYRQGDVITDPEDLRILNELDWVGTDFSADTLLAPGEAPVPKVSYWEIGNEVDYYDTPEVYRGRYRTITQQMIQADPTIKVGPNVTGLPYSGQVGSYLHEVMRQRTTFFGLIKLPLEQVDFISYHPYDSTILAIDDSDHDGIVTTLNNLKATQYDNRALIQGTIVGAGRNPSNIELLATEWNPSTYDNTWRFRQFNGLGVVETAMTYAELGLTAANFWVWPAYIATGDTYSQYFAFEALADYGGDTLVESYTENNIRLYVTRDSTTGTVTIWGLNFAFGDPGDQARTLQLSLENLGIDAGKVTFMRLADLDGPTTLLSQDVGWITSDVTGMDLSSFSFTINPAELSLLVIQTPEPAGAGLMAMLALPFALRRTRAFPGKVA